MCVSKDNDNDNVVSRVSVVQSPAPTDLSLPIAVLTSVTILFVIALCALVGVMRTTCRENSVKL